jgi:DNA-binding SARP family transcriptional activator
MYIGIGEAKRAIDALRRALSYDPAREDLHQELVASLVKLGRHKEAKEQISECVRLLREELGVEPTAETQRLYRGIVAAG